MCTGSYYVSDDPLDHNATSDAAVRYAYTDAPYTLVQQRTIARHTKFTNKRIESDDTVQDAHEHRTSTDL